MADLRIVHALEALGFNLNEARAYAALIARGPSTGYEVGQHANIPRSAVYGSLRRLVAEGAARCQPGPPERFFATPPDTLLGHLQKRFQQSSRELEEAIASAAVADAAPDAFGVRGYDRILEEGARIAQSAQRTLVLSGWPRELALLAEELGAAQTRGVFVVLFSHAALSPSIPGAHFSYGFREADLEAFWKHRLVLVGDDKNCLLGATERSTSDRAVVSHTEAIAEIAVSQVALDITLLSQRHDFDAGAILAKLLGDRVGRLDSLLGKTSAPELGFVHGPTAKELAPRAVTKRRAKP